ncbi:MAG: putative metal-binding motif-containing protein [Myxococcales bacterium]|nr:putative metal-binding motif-containing protein [Myxococcales bacterium]
MALISTAGCGDDDPRVPVDAEPSDALTPDAGDGGASSTCAEPGETIGRACASSAECSDGCICNGVETCADGVCVAGADPCDDGIECTSDDCDESAGRCVFEASDESCDDGDLCNGAEVCALGLGCRPGPRLLCNDGDACTVGRCDSSEGCSFELRDLDGDGFADDRCGGLDCNDDPVIGGSIYPGAPEVCDNGIDDNCNRLVDYRDPTCSGVNDDCESREVLPGPGSWVRTTRGLRNDYVLGCRPTGLDAVFGFTLTERQDVQAVVEVEGGGNGAVAIRPAVECSGSGPDGYCAGGGATSSVTARDLPPGEYVVMVKTSTAATYVLSLVYAAPTPVQPVDVCTSDTLDISAGGTFTGLFVDVTDQYEIACRASSATQVRRDVAYRLTITEPKDVVLRASTRSTSSTRPSTFLTLVRDCSSPATSLACVQAQDAQIQRRALEPGTYYVLIESASTTAVSWELQASVVDAMPRNPADACGSVLDITDATVTVPLSSLELDYGTSCGGNGSTFRDASFEIVLAEERDIILESTVGGIHYVAVSSSCGNAATETLCASGTPTVTRRILRAPPGRHFVTVSTALSSGDLVISARTEPPTVPPSNDRCDAAILIDDGMEVRGTFLGASDQALACGPADAHDLFFRLELAERRNVTLVARRTDGETEPMALGLRPGTCTSPAPEPFRCASGGSALLNRTLDAGSHLIVLESPAVAPGTFALTAYFAEP